MMKAEPECFVSPQSVDMEMIENEDISTNSNDGLTEEDMNADNDADSMFNQCSKQTGRDSLISSRYTSPTGIVYEVLEGVSRTGRRKLYDNLGYSYYRKRKSNRGCVSWYCSSCAKSRKCAAYVKEHPAGVFEQSRHSHCHSPKYNESVVDSIYSVAKKNAIEYPQKNISTVVEEAILEYAPEGYDSSDLPSVKNIKNKVAKHRKMFQKDPKSLANWERKINKTKRKAKLNAKERKKKKKRYEHLMNQTPSSKKQTKTKQLKTEKSGQINEDDFVLMYVPRKYLKKMFNHGISVSKKTQNVDSSASELLCESPAAHNGENNISCQETSNTADMQYAMENVQCHKGTNGPKRIPVYAESSQKNDLPSQSSPYFDDNIPTIAEIPLNTYQDNTTVCQDTTSILDVEDMFFHSISSEIKTLPKLVKSRLKLEILSLVNATLHNDAQE
ncbi:uncharacterized protein LOC144421907 isoform X2 [Styela clava]